MNTKQLILAAAVLAVGLASPGARAQSPFKTRAPIRHVLICNSANDFYGWELPPSQYSELAGVPNALRDRDAFPAQALQAYGVMKSTIGVNDNRISLMLFHDDAAGNSFCEPGLTGGADNNLVNDQFVNQNGMTPPPGPPNGNELWGPNGIQGDWDDPVIDFQDFAVTKANLQAAIQTIGTQLTGNDDVLIYLVDHGATNAQTGQGNFFFEAGIPTPDPGDDFVSGAEFDGWLDAAFCGSLAPRRVTILADFCYSAAFLTPLLQVQGCGEERRIGVSAADWQSLAYYNVDKYMMDFMGLGGWPCAAVYPMFSGSLFFRPFWDAIKAGKGVQEAYDEGWTAGDCWATPANRVGRIQRPQLFDGDVTATVQFNLMVPFGPKNYLDIEWRPDGELALVVGQQNTVAQYIKSGMPQTYQIVTVQSPGGSSPTLWGAAWNPAGTEAVSVGAAGKIQRHDPWGYVIAQIPANAGSQTTADLYAIDFSSSISTASTHGCRALIVGDAGTILRYDGTKYFKVLPTGAPCASWTAPTADFRGVAFRPLDDYQPPPNPGAPAITTSVATIVGVTGAWKYEFKSFEYSGQPSLNYTCEKVSKVFPTIPTTLVYELWGVQWDPAGDFALIGGFYTGASATQWGALIRLDASGALTTYGTNVQNERFFDVSFKPNGTYALICGNNGTILRHEGDTPGNFKRYSFTSTPAVPTGNILYGVHWKPNSSHAMTVGVSGSVTRYQELHKL